MVSSKQILEQWHAQGALWLMEEPQFFENNKNAFLDAIKQCTETPEHQELLEELAQPGVPMEIRYAIAANINTPIAVLRRLAEDKDKCVRAAVAINSNTPTDTLFRLAEDKSARVLNAVAYNVKTPPEASAKLEKSVEEWWQRMSPIIDAHLEQLDEYVRKMKESTK